ncbi:nucleoside transporter [Babesia ovata]|uniref:Nucleoside transporter n=1 Tax=Babesia ovata TaxID=189622 RepID=A0A2H6KHQ5_9APIC|nr:nucleoside transporter [Babesia ovata]GBE62520.1 nucleoside transporter [Babesia ovata]
MDDTVATVDMSSGENFVEKHASNESPKEKLSRGMLAYSMISCICQGFCVLLCVHSSFMLAGMASDAFGVSNFAGMVVYLLEGASCLFNIIVFWCNAVKPWLPVVVSFAQALASIAQIIVLQMCEGDTGKYAYLAVVGVFGLIFGCNGISSFALAAFGPVNNLGPFTFGYALGGVLPFVFSTILRTTVYTGTDAASVKGMMSWMLGFLAVMSTVSATNMVIYLTREPIKRHYEQIKLDGISTVKCTFRSAIKGLRHAWRIVLIECISYTTLLGFYPGIIPSAMKMEVGRRVMLIGIFQISETFGRGTAVFIDNKWLPCNNLNRIIGLVISNIGTAGFLVLCTIYHDNAFLGNIVVITIGVITFGAVGGYCNSFSDKSIEGELPPELEREVRVSTTTVFRIIVSFLCTLGGFLSTLLVKAFPDHTEALKAAAAAAAAKAGEAGADVAAKAAAGLSH